MALTSFENNLYQIKHGVDYPEIVCVEFEDTMEIVLKVHPLTGNKVIDKLELTSSNNDYVVIWKNATGLTYDPIHDQITGFIVTKDLPDPITNEIKYHDRAFCMNLSGDPSARTLKLHCYVSKSLTGGGGDPDDGSWAGDVD